MTSDSEMDGHGQVASLAVATGNRDCHSSSDMQLIDGAISHSPPTTNDLRLISRRHAERRKRNGRKSGRQEEEWGEGLGKRG